MFGTVQLGNGQQQSAAQWQLHWEGISGVVASNSSPAAQLAHLPDLLRHKVSTGHRTLAVQPFCQIRPTIFKQPNYFLSLRYQQRCDDSRPLHFAQTSSEMLGRSCASVPHNEHRGYRPTSRTQILKFCSVSPAGRQGGGFVITFPTRPSTVVTSDRPSSVQTATVQSKVTPNLSVTCKLPFATHIANLSALPLLDKADRRTVPVPVVVGRRPGYTAALCGKWPGSGTS